MMERKEMGKFVILASLLMLSVNSALLSTSFFNGLKFVRKIKVKPSKIGETEINIFLILQNRITELQIDVGRVRISSYQYYLEPKHTFDKKKSYYRKQIKYLKFILIQLQSSAKEVEESKQITQLQRTALLDMNFIARLGAEELIKELKQWIQKQKPKVNRPFVSIPNLEAPEHDKKTLVLVFYHKIQSLQLHAISIFASFLSQCINSFESREKLYKRGMEVIKKLKKIHREIEMFKRLIKDCHGLTKKMKQLLTNYMNELQKDISGYIGWIMDYFLPDMKTQILKALRPV